MPIPDLVRLIELELRLDVELAANESRGPARIASAQLRAFVDELHAFLAADESGSISNLLAWLDHAEQLDEFAPRTEPPEDDVVQLLTIHGSKGLEWDAVAVVRLVKDELPSMPRDTKGWLGFGILPYSFRGDARWLPALQWETGCRAHAAGPEGRDRRVRRRQPRAPARRGPAAGVRRRHPRARPPAAHRCELVGHQAAARTGASSSARSPRRSASSLPDDDPGEDPYLGERRVLQWPIDPLGAPP